MASVNKATLLNQLQATANQIKQYILQQIADLADAVQADMDAKYTKPESGIPEEDLSPEILASLSSGELLASVLPTCPTERVADGTRILASIRGRKLCAQHGFYYDVDYPDRLYIYAIWCLVGIPNCASRKAYVLRSQNAPDTPTELTMETAPTTTELSIGNLYFYSSRLSLGSFSGRSPTDVRLVFIGYDADGNEIERVYSAQYRYTLENGIVTRTKFAVANTAADHIVDIGLVANTAFAEERWVGIWPSHTLMPLVSTNEPIAYNFVVPDSFFTGNEYGLRIAVVSGAGLAYLGPNVYQADADEKSLPTVTSSDNGKVLMVVNGDWAAGSIPSAVGVSF